MPSESGTLDDEGDEDDEDVSMFGIQMKKMLGSINKPNRLY